MLFVIITKCHAQDEWDWGWSESARESEHHDHFTETINNPEARQAIYGKLIWFYKKKISPVQSRQCPFYPTCSTYTLYSMQKYGFFMGLLMGIDRLYLRENVGVLRKIFYLPIKKNGKEPAYDPPEATYIFGKKDWRTIDPDFYPLFFDK